MLKKRGIWRERFESFAEFLKFVLVQEDGDGPSVASVSIKLDIPQATFYKYLEGKRPFPIDKLARLAEIDRRFLSYFTEQLGLALIEPGKPRLPVDRDVFSELIASEREHVEAAGSVLRALADGKVSVEEAVAARREIREAVEALMTLDATLARAAG